MLGDFVAAFDKAGDEQVFAIGVTQDDASAIGRRDDAKSVTLLFVAHRGKLPKFGGRLLGSFGSGAADGEIGIIGGTASGGTGSAVAAQTTEAASACDAAERKDGAVVAVDGELLVVAVGDRARGIDEPGPHDGTDDIHFLRSPHVDAVSQAAGKSEARSVRSGEQYAAPSYEGLQVRDAFPAEAGAHVVRRIVFADEVRRLRRVFPGQRITPVARHAVDDGRRGGVECNGRKKDYVVFRVEVIALRNGLCADVVVRNF